jgi:hypothetical protein
MVPRCYTVELSAFQSDGVDADRVGLGGSWSSLRVVSASEAVRFAAGAAARAVGRANAGISAIAA